MNMEKTTNRATSKDEGAPRRRAARLIPWALPICALVALGLGGCSDDDGHPPNAEGYVKLVDVDIDETGVGDIEGEARLTAHAKGVLATIEVEDAAPGRYHVHLHRAKSCDADQIERPSDVLRPDAPGQPAALQTANRTGELGELIVGKNGEGKLQRIIHDVDLDKGIDGLVGRTLVIHDATGKIALACGAIQRG